jgi:hypothetical protein
VSLELVTDSFVDLERLFAETFADHARASFNVDAWAGPDPEHLKALRQE